MTPGHNFPAATDCCTVARCQIHARGLAVTLTRFDIRCVLLSFLVAAGLFLGESGIAFSQEQGASPAADGAISELQDIGKLRAAQQAELNAARVETKGDIAAYRQRAAEIKSKHLQSDRRGQYTDEVVSKNGRYGGDIENTGSNPKDVRADVDLAAKNKAAADKLTQDWRRAGHQVEDHGYKVVNKTTDTTLWKPCNTPECLRAKVADPDAWTTEGGLKATGNTERIRDPRGQYLDNAKKFFHAKDDFGQATANPDAIDELKAFESVKTAAKSVDKAAEAAGIKQNDEFWQKIENIRKKYMDPWEAGIADPNDPPAKQIKDIEKFIADAETKMATAEEVLTRRGQTIDKQVREKIQEDLRNARQADPKNKAMDQEGADAIKARRDKVKASNEAVEKLLAEQGHGAKRPGTSADAPEGGIIEEPVRLSETGDAPPKSATGVDEPAPIAEQPDTSGARSDLRKSAAAAVKSAATGAAVGGLLGAATTYLTCMAVLSPDATNENCLAAAGQSIPEAGFWGAVGALGPAGAAVAGIYGTYQTGVAVKEAINELDRMSGALDTEMQAASNFRAAQVAEQEEISRARRACNFERALGLAKELRRRPPPPTWLAATMPHIERGAMAQRNVTTLLALVTNTSDRDSQAKLLNLAHNAAAGVPCLQKKVQAARDKLERTRPAEASRSTGSESKTGTAQAGGKDCDPNKVASGRKNSDGFVPVEYKGATAWTGETNPDCPPFGPAAKQAPHDGAGGEGKKVEAPKASSCSKVDTALGRAREHYLSGRISEYRTALVSARQEIGAITDPKACANQRGEIEKGGGRADLLEKVIKSAERALTECQPRHLQKLSGVLAKTSHPHVVQLRGRVDRMAAVAAKVDQADARLTDGDRNRAGALYREAAAGLNADGNACPALARHVREAQARLQTASLTHNPEANALAKAENACKSNLGSRGIAIPDPDSLTGFTCDCADPYTLDTQACVRKKSTGELADAAHEVCRAEFGSASYAQANTPDFKKYGCLCGKGYGWNSAKTQCVQQTREQVMADAHRACQRSNNNRHARAAKYLGDGRWSCTIPGKRRVVNRRPQGQPNYDAAAAAAAAAVIIGGIGAVMQNRVSRVPHRSVGGCHPGAVGGVFRACR